MTYALGIYENFLTKLNLLYRNQLSNEIIEGPFYNLQFNIVLIYDPRIEFCTTCNL